MDGSERTKNSVVNQFEQFTKAATESQGLLSFIGQLKEDILGNYRSEESPAIRDPKHIFGKLKLNAREGIEPDIEDLQP